jgi:RHS repeat-associated protein
MNPRRCFRVAPLAALIAAFLLSAFCRAATFIVTNNADTGTGTLRQAITDANADATSPRAINFNIPGAGVQTITLVSALPAIARAATIDGTTQPGYAGTPLIVLDGNFGDFDGLVINAFFTGNSNNTSAVKGLCIINCGVNGGTARNGLILRDADNVTVLGCYLGINPAGTAAARNTGAGIRTELAVSTIGGAAAASRNVVSGNLGPGIDANTDNQTQGSAVTILGNYIGTSADGMNAVPNGGDGIFAARKNTSGTLIIGGGNAGEANVISGNGGDGVDTQRFAMIPTNFIGVAKDGTTPLGNANHGIFVDGTTCFIDSGPAAHSVISSNGGDGVHVAGSTSPLDRSTIRGNYIGTDVTGTLARGNGGDGVNIVLGSAALGNNVISANTGFGVHVASGDGNISTSKIGTNAAGTAALGNGGGGIWVDNVPNLTITSSTVSGNIGPGIKISGANATGDTITGNDIGTNGVGGGADFGNTGDGILISDGAAHEVIGGTVLDSNVNRIHFNGGAGVKFDSCNRVLFNRILANAGPALDGGAFDPPTITAVRDTAFVDEKDIDLILSNQSPSTPLRIFVFLNDVAGQDLAIPSGSTDVTSDPGGSASATVHVMGSFADPTFANTYTVTNPTSNPNTSCTSRVSAGVAVAGGGGPPPITADTTGNTNTALNTDDPINTFIGELFDLEKVDLNLGGPMPLFFARYYASQLAADGNITSPLGRNRLHNFDAKLTVTGSAATAVLSDGRVVQFMQSGGAWTLTGRMDVVFQLVQNGATFVLADPRSQRMWTFDGNGRLAKIEDGRGNTHALSYDASGKLTAVNDGLGRSLAFTYDAGSHLIGLSDGTRTVAFTYAGSDLATAADPLGHTTTYSYDASGHLLSTQRPRGNAPVSQTYDRSSRVATQTEHPASGDQTTALAYDTNTHATTITDPTGKTRIHTHTATGEATAFTDEENKSVAMGSDAAGRRSTVTDRLGRTTMIAYHVASGQPSSITTADGATSSFDYTGRTVGGITFFDLTKVTLADGSRRSFAYDASGNVVTVVDELGKSSQFSYNNRGQLLTATNPRGGLTTYTYDAAGNLATSKDSDTAETIYTYDAFSRLARATYPDGSHFDIFYDAADRLTSMTDERGEIYTFTYDNNDNLTSITDPASASVQLGYDALDRVERMTNRLGKTRTRTFDARDQLGGETDELSHTTTIAHDPRRRVSAVTDSGGATVAFGYNDEAELTSVTDPLAHTTTLLRNLRGEVIGVTDPLGQTIQVNRDLLQRVTKFTDELGRNSTFTFEARGQLASSSRDGTGTASYAYDEDGNLTRITDPLGLHWDYGYTPAGLPISSTDPLGRTTGFTYDSRGDLTSLALPEGGTCTIERDAADNITRLLFTDGTDLHFGYDALDRVISANDIVLTRDAEGRITGSSRGGVNFGATYDDVGRLTGVSYNNGALLVTYAYDVNDRLASVSDNLSGASVIFTRDAAGRMTNITRSNGANSTLTYDAADRLTRLQDGTFLDLQYTLDAAGEVRSTDFTAPLSPTVTADEKQFTYNAANEVSTAGFTYDARGRLIAAPGHSFAWDAASHLKLLDGTSLTYDGSGDVSTRTVAGATTRFFHHAAVAGHPLVAERNEGTTQFTRFYVWTPSGTLLYSIDGATHAPTFYHYDHVGSTLALTDSAGAVSDKYAYSPYGELLGHEGASTQPFTFIGAFGVLAEGPLYKMRARYYDPLTARFLSRDPASPRLSDPRTLDPYLYALGSPLRYVDPDGEAPTATNFDVAFGLFFFETFAKPFLDLAEIPEEGIPTRVEQPTLPKNEVFNRSKPDQLVNQALRVTAGDLNDVVAVSSAPKVLESLPMTSADSIVVQQQNQIATTRGDQPPEPKSKGPLKLFKQFVRKVLAAQQQAQKEQEEKEAKAKKKAAKEKAKADKADAKKAAAEKQHAENQAERDKMLKEAEKQGYLQKK